MADSQPVSGVRERRADALEHIRMIDCRSERQEPTSFGAVSLRAAQLRRWLDEPLTLPLGSVLAPDCFVRPEREDDEITLVQDWSKRERLVLADPLPVESLSSTEVLAAEPEQRAALQNTHVRSLPAPTTPARAALAVPDAPPRSSALFAGIIDGWERLPSKTARVRKVRPWAQAADRYQVWATAAVLAVFALVTAFALTLQLVPRQHRGEPASLARAE